MDQNPHDLHDDGCMHCGEQLDVRGFCPNGEPYSTQCRECYAGITITGHDRPMCPDCDEGWRLDELREREEDRRVEAALDAWRGA